MVRTHADLGEPLGITVSRHYLRGRRPDKAGVIQGVVPGHGGDVYWVQHEWSTVWAPYCYDEFELEPAPRPRQTRTDFIVEVIDSE